MSTPKNSLHVDGLGPEEEKYNVFSWFPNPSLPMEEGKINKKQTTKKKTLLLRFIVQSHLIPDETNNKDRFE